MEWIEVLRRADGGLVVAFGTSPCGNKRRSEKARWLREEWASGMASRGVACARAPATAEIRCQKGSS